MKTFLRSTCLLLLLAAGLAGCANPVAGTWRNVQQNGRSIPNSRQLTTTFGNFGAVTMADSRTATPMQGSYLVRNDLITLQADGHEQTYHYKITGDELRLDGAGGSVVFRRAAPRR